MEIGCKILSSQSKGIKTSRKNDPSITLLYKKKLFTSLIVFGRRTKIKFFIKPNSYSFTLAVHSKKKNVKNTGMEGQEEDRDTRRFESSDAFFLGFNIWKYRSDFIYLKWSRFKTKCRFSFDRRKTNLSG